jgi:thiamine biosynthesis lipoprotein
MGTVVSLLARAEPRRVDDVHEAIAEAVAWLHEVDDRFTTYRDSEWLAWCRGEIDLDRAHPDLRHVVGVAADLEAATHGAFSIHADPGRPPDAAAYVKGWAVQRANDLLLAGGATAACTNGGGDVAVAGSGPAWRIGIADPRTPQQLAAVVELAHGAVATSGTYERGLHLYEPRSGRPATTFASVTVVGPDLGLADAWSTAAAAMGDSALAWLATLDGYHAFVVGHDGSTARVGFAPVAA